jgi:hypothetical protein
MLGFRSALHTLKGQKVTRCLIAVDDRLDVQCERNPGGQMYDIEGLFVLLTPATLLLIKEQLGAFKRDLDDSELVEQTRVDNTIMALDAVHNDKTGEDRI